MTLFATEPVVHFRRAWAMPSSETFAIAPIAGLLAKWIGPVLRAGGVVVDPFARNSTWGTLRNDLNPETTAQHHLPAEEFAASLAAESADAVLFDPPYSPRQISECYIAAGIHPAMADTQNSRLYSLVRRGLATALRPGGLAISFGWNSTGFGKAWPTLDMLIVCHGGAHNDTICVVQRKPEASS